MSEFDRSEGLATAVKLAAAVGRLRVASNLKAVADAQQQAFLAAGEAAAAVAEAASRERAAQAGRYREASGALGRCRAWLEVMAELTNEPLDVFGEELRLLDDAAKLVNANLRALDARDRDARPPRDMRGPRDGRGPREEVRAPREEPRPRPQRRGRGTSQPGGLR